MHNHSTEKGESIANYWDRAQDIYDRCLEAKVPLDTGPFWGRY